MNKEKLLFLGSINAIFILFFSFVFGFKYALPVLFFLDLVIVPTYISLSRFISREYELVFLSLFLGIGIFPTIVYLIGRILSLTASILIGVIILWALAFYSYYTEKKKKN